MKRRKRALPKRTRQLRTQSKARDLLVTRAEHLFAVRWQSVANPAISIVEQWLRQEGFTTDALGKDWSVVLRRIDELFANPREWRQLFGKVALSVDESVIEGLERTIPQIDRRRLLPSGRTEKFARENSALIKGVSDMLKQQVSEFFGEASPQAHVKELTEQLQAKFDVGESRARLWARDQTLKLHGEITRERHEAVGITSYFWTDADDERVREIHAELGRRSDGGEAFEYRDPPIMAEDGRRGNPGDDYQCRCTAYPNLEATPARATPERVERVPEVRAEPEPPAPVAVSETAPAVTLAEFTRRGSAVSEYVDAGTDAANALKSYVSSSGGVNNYMRERARGAPLDADAERNVQLIKQAMREVRERGGGVDGTVLRGESLDAARFKLYATSNTIDFEAFISATASAEEAKGFARAGRRAIVEIRQRGGVPVGALDLFGDNSKEVLLEPGRFRVLQRSIRGKQIRLRLERV